MTLFDDLYVARPAKVIRERWDDPGGEVNGAGPPARSYDYAEIKDRGDYRLDLSDLVAELIREVAPEGLAEGLGVRGRLDGAGELCLWVE